jgi:hypothetical protein
VTGSSMLSRVPSLVIPLETEMRNDSSLTECPIFLDYAHFWLKGGLSGGISPRSEIPRETYFYFVVVLATAILKSSSSLGVQNSSLSGF